VCKSVRAEVINTMRVENKTEGTRLAVGVAEAARMADLSRRSIEMYITLKLLPSVKVGRRRLVRIKDLERFLSADRPSAREVRNEG
jgi:excisionase family DNA binding protein